MLVRRAFTLIELLVVVAIIALLIAILIPALGRAKDNAKKALCGTHLKSQGTAFAVYASGNNDSLPSDRGGGWLHDQSFATVSALMGAAQTANAAMGGLSEASIRKWFYCPTNPECNTDDNWKGAIKNSSGVVTGYSNRPFLNYNYFNYGSFTNLHVGSFSGDRAVFERQSKRLPKIQLYRKMSLSQYASVAELACDEICSNNVANPDFSMPIATSVSYMGERSSHLKGVKPTGMNALAFDGSVTWRGTSNSTRWDTTVGPPDATVTGILAADQNDQNGQKAGMAVMWVIDPQ
jgi:prepilin-type N-terminal cleavage/methylation domain-containing protein